MAVSTDNAHSGPYLTDGLATVFPFTFTAAGDADIAVVTFTEAGDGAVLPPSLYSVARGPDAGGSVTCHTAPAAGLRLFVLLDPPFTQDIAFENGSGWLAEPVNEGYDRAALRDQALRRDIARAPKVAIGVQPPVIGNYAEGQVLGVVEGRLQGVANTAVAADSAATRAETARAGAMTAQSNAEGAQAGAEAAAQNAEHQRDQAGQFAAHAEEARDATLAFSNQDVRATWTELAALTGTAGRVGIVLASDTGSHTDPVAGNIVPNAGQYTYSTSPAGWRWRGALESQLAKAAAGEVLAALAAVNSRIEIYETTEFEEQEILLLDTSGEIVSRFRGQRVSRV